MMEEIINIGAITADSLRPALSLGGQATAWECSPGRSLCLTKTLLNLPPISLPIPPL